MPPSTPRLLFLTLVLVVNDSSTRAFVPTKRPKKNPKQKSLGLSSGLAATAAATHETAIVVDDAETSSTVEDAIASLPSAGAVKADLLQTLSNMQGTSDDYQRVQACVNRLEAEYTPVLTLDFFNLAAAGTWQLLFSTQLSKSRPNPAQFRLRELTQTMVPHAVVTAGYLETAAVWDLAPAADAKFTCSGTFTTRTTYQMAQGGSSSRQQLQAADEMYNTLRLAKGSQVPADVPALVALLHKAMPNELWKAANHAMDTTYLDDTLRIVRYTGERLEGVRDIFIRTDSSWTARTTTTEDEQHRRPQQQQQETDTTTQVRNIAASDQTTNMTDEEHENPLF